jgi:hypothetical protein
MSKGPTRRKQRGEVVEVVARWRDSVVVADMDAGGVDLASVVIFRQQDSEGGFLFARIVVGSG